MAACVCAQLSSDFSTYAGPLATMFAALSALCVTAYFAWHQKKTANAQAFIAKEKLRLDLYDRRFEVFISILDFYEAMISWENPPTPGQTAARIKFFRAYRESEFLFKKASGIEKLYKHLYDEAMIVINFKESPDLYKGNHELSKKREDIKIRVFEEGLQELRVKMAEYLSFDNIDRGSKM